MFKVLNFQMEKLPKGYTAEENLFFLLQLQNVPRQSEEIDN